MFLVSTSSIIYTNTTSISSCISMKSVFIQLVGHYIYFTTSLLLN